MNYEKILSILHVNSGHHITCLTFKSYLMVSALGLVVWYGSLLCYPSPCLTYKLKNEKFEIDKKWDRQ